MKNKKTKIKRVLIGGLIGLFLPLILLWTYFGIALKDTPDAGIAILPLLILSIPFMIIGVIFGINIAIKRWSSVIGASIGLSLGIIYFLIKYIPYTQLSTIEQRGFTDQFFISVGIMLLLTIIGSLIGLIFKKK